MRRIFAPAVAALALTLLTHPAEARDDSLAQAFRILQSKTFVDLTHSFSPTTPVWSGFGQAKMTPMTDPKTHEPYTVAKDGFRATYYEMVGQYGTHVDPPAHFSDTGRTMDLIPPKDMLLKLVVFDITPLLGADPNHALSIDDIKAWEKKNGRVPKGAFAALRTDMSKDWITNPERFKREPFPAWSLAAVKFLVEQRGVTAIGHEALDSDTTEKMDTETYILSSGHYQIEGMAHLDKVPPKGALIFVTWPKVKDGLGFPARAIAILP
jgi:kynurenine formamidase